MRKTLLFFSCWLCSGCIGTADYYASKSAYYEAQARANIAYIQAVDKPLAEMTAPDGTRFVVNNTAIQAPRIEQANSPIVDGLKTILNSTPAAIMSGGWAGSEIIKHSTGQLTNTGNGTINTNSGNSALQSEAGIDQSVTDDHTNNAATPTIVNQPEPTIVTQPEPTIVTQPEPIVVTQPEPIIVRQE